MDLVNSVSFGHLNQVKHLLLVEGVDPNPPKVSNLPHSDYEYDNECNIPLLIAIQLKSHVRSDYDEIVELLLNHPDINLTVTDDNGNNILHIAAEHGHNSVIKRVLELRDNANKQIDINALTIGDDGITPLDLALENDHYDTAVLLAENGAIVLGDHLIWIINAYVEDNYYFSALLDHYHEMDETRFMNIMLHVIESGNYEIFNILIDHHPELAKKVAKELDCCQLSETIRTDLIHYEPDYSFIEQLLKLGANINKKDSWFGTTPLHNSIKFGLINDHRKEIITILLNYGADKDIKDDNGMTPEELARDRDNHEIANLIRDYHIEDVKEPECL
jgi:ankyrin repeat protein